MSYFCVKNLYLYSKHLDFGKPLNLTGLKATQSTNKKDNYGGVAERAIDGDRRQKYWNTDKTIAYCTYSLARKGVTWWQVQLKKIYHITKVHAQGYTREQDSGCEIFFST